jgi:hypothetical protein
MARITPGQPVTVPLSPIPPAPITGAAGRRVPRRALGTEIAHIMPVGVSQCHRRLARRQAGSAPSAAVAGPRSSETTRRPD